MVLTPQGRVSRYFYGVDFPPKDLRMGLVEASQGKIGNAVDSSAAVLLSLRSGHRKIRSHRGQYLRLAAAATILILGIFLFIMFRLERSVARRTTPRSATKQAGYVR